MDDTHTTPGGRRTTLGKRSVARIGYGAMQLEHCDQQTAVGLLRHALELGVDHVDTASFYGDATVNRYICHALSGDSDRVAIVSKVGARRVTGTPRSSRRRSPRS